MTYAPTVGRIVHYEPLTAAIAPGPHAAMVTGVYGDPMLADLTVLPPGRDPYCAPKVPKASPQGPPGAGTWRWPEGTRERHAETDLPLPGDVAARAALAGARRT